MTIDGMVRIRALSTREFWRINVVWARGYVQVLWLEEWGAVNARGDLGWCVRRPLLTMGR